EPEGVSVGVMDRPSKKQVDREHFLKVSQTQCQDGDLTRVAPAYRNLGTSGKSPGERLAAGWEEVSDLSDTQMCGLLPVRGWDNSLIRRPCQAE
ncbi:Ras GTPase-activating protein gap-2, partial [Dissostichus eleginoides]